ncbi:MAG: HAD family hydrolase [Oscillospiraceae bacterium]|nr:HAD family hydrolase [Oscillospiraceae bacterium]
MINTILFDLDGTLLPFSQAAFVENYFPRLGKVFAEMGLDAQLCVKAVWAGTKAMAQNDGGALNCQRFWAAFSKAAGLEGERLRMVEDACDSFYTGDFDAVKEILSPADISGQIVRAVKTKGYTAVLATNPLFPACAITTRLGWIGLEPGDFALITHYANSSYCKPNPGYYREILEKLGRPAQNCLMAGNNTAEDMCAGELGAQTFLVTDFLENESGMDITKFTRGTLEDFGQYLSLLPDIS